MGGEDVGGALGMFVRLWSESHLEMSFAGMVFNITDSTANGPYELASFTVDGVELGKPTGTSRLVISVWHFQVGLWWRRNPKYHMVTERAEPSAFVS